VVEGALSFSVGEERIYGCGRTRPLTPKQIGRARRVAPDEFAGERTSYVQRQGDRRRR
jgi:hypothetical protein